MANRSSSLLLATLLLVTSCGINPLAPSAPAPDPLPSFTTEKEWTDGDSMALGDGDDFDSLLMGGPFYGGRQPSTVPAVAAYEALRAATVTRAIEQTTAVRDSAVALQEPTTLLQEASITFLKNAVATDKKTGKDSMRPVADAFVAARVKQEALKASIDALAPSMDDAVVYAALQYQRTMLALELAGEVQYDLARSIGICAQLAMYDASASDAVKPLVATLDAACAKVAFSEQLTTLQSNVALLGDSLDRLDKADAFFARATVDATKLQVADLQAKVDGLTPRDGLDTDTIALAKEQLEVMKSVLAQLDATVETPGAPVPPTAGLGLVQVVYADDYLGSALDLLKSGASMAASATKTAASYTYTGLKAVAQAAQTTTGVVVDITKATVDATTDAIIGATDGKGLVDTVKTTQGHFQKVADNFRNGTSGSQVYKDAGEMLEGVEKAGQKTAEDAIAGTIGAGWTSWLAGHAAKTTVGMFTGFGKGLYKIADPTSTKGQLAEGALEVGLSLVGGSKVLVKGSQILKGTPTAMRATALKTLTVMEKEAAASEIALLKSINAKILKNAKPSASDVERLMMNSRSIEAKEAAMKALSAANKKLDDALTELAGKGGNAVWKNLTVDSAKSFNEFVKESFTNSLTGYLKAARTTMGGSMKEYFDNLVAEKGDDAIQALARSIIDGLPLFGTVDFTGTYKGVWVPGDVSIPVTITVAGETLTPSIVFSVSEDGTTATLRIGGSGTAMEDGSVKGKMSGTFDMATIHADISGTYDGTISKDQLTITTHLVAALSGSFWDKPLSGTQPVDQVTLVLKKV